MCVCERVCVRVCVCVCLICEHVCVGCLCIVTILKGYICPYASAVTYAGGSMSFEKRSVLRASKLGLRVV